MSLEALRQNCIAAFEEAATAHTNSAMNMLPGMVQNADQYALAQVDRLAFARGMLKACEIITAEFKKLTQPEEKDNVTVMKKTTGAVY